jgi:hypothetical protein
MFDNPEIAVIGAAYGGQYLLIIQYDSYAFVQKNLGPRIPAAGNIPGIF